MLGKCVTLSYITIIVRYFFGKKHMSLNSHGLSQQVSGVRRCIILQILDVTVIKKTFFSRGGKLWV